MQFDDLRRLFVHPPPKNDQFYTIITTRFLFYYPGQPRRYRAVNSAPGTIGVEFDETLLVKRRTNSRNSEKLKPRWDYQIFVGV